MYYRREQGENAASCSRSGLYLSNLRALCYMYRPLGGPFLRVEVRVGAQLNFIIRIGGNPTPRAIFFFTKMKRVRKLCSGVPGCNRSARSPLFSHRSRDIRDSCTFRRWRGEHAQTFTHSLSDYELTLHPRRTAVKLYTSRPRAYARWRIFCLIARSLFTPRTLCSRHSSLRHTVSGQGRYLLHSQE